MDNIEQYLDSKGRLVDQNPDALRNFDSLAHHLKKLVKESLRTAEKVKEEEKLEKFMKQTTKTLDPKKKESKGNDLIKVVDAEVPDEDFKKVSNDAFYD